MNESRLPAMMRIGYRFKVCDLCKHGRFYTPRKFWGVCAKYSDEKEVVDIHKLGHCENGFSPRDADFRVLGISTYIDL